MTKPYTLNPIRYLFLAVFVLVLCAAVSGCGPTWKRKFVRKRAPQEPDAVFSYQPQDYQREPNIERYKRHFIFWKSWQEELITKLGNNRKADARAFEEALKDLGEMKTCLKDDKAAELDIYIKKLEGFSDSYSTGQFDVVRSNQMKTDLSRLMLKIDKAFRYNKAKDYIK